MLGYSVYNYANYVFGTAFNDVFLVHIALFSLSVFAFALAMMGLDIPGIARQFSERTPVRLVSTRPVLVGFGLSARRSCGLFRVVSRMVGRRPAVRLSELHPYHRR
jgi:hypothetical protein